MRAFIVLFAVVAMAIGVGVDVEALTQPTGARAAAASLANSLLDSAVLPPRSERTHNSLVEPFAVYFPPVRDFVERDTMWSTPLSDTAAIASIAPRLGRDCTDEGGAFFGFFRWDVESMIGPESFAQCALDQAASGYREALDYVVAASGYGPTFVRVDARVDRLPVGLRSEAVPTDVRFLTVRQLIETLNGKSLGVARSATSVAPAIIANVSALLDSLPLGSGPDCSFLNFGPSQAFYAYSLSFATTPTSRPTFVVTFGPYCGGGHVRAEGHVEPTLWYGPPFMDPLRAEIARVLKLGSALPAYRSNGEGP